MRKDVRSPLIFSCEHGGNEIPAEFRQEFREHAQLLSSHRGWDPGSLQLARTLARQFAAPLVFSKVSRLLIELNRSLRHPRLFSEVSGCFDQARKRRVLMLYYLPFRRKVLKRVKDTLSHSDRVVHVSVHSFTPFLKNLERKADVGLLYDPRRKPEAEFCRLWKAALHELAPQLRVRRNYPYQGSADGHTSALRRLFPAGEYLGIELEINQKYPLGDPQSWKQLRTQIAASLERIQSRQQLQ